MSNFDLTVYPSDYARPSLETIQSNDCPEIGLVCHKTSIKFILPNNVDVAFIDNLVGELIPTILQRLKEHQSESQDLIL